MNKIEKTDTYAVNHQNGAFKLYISKHDNGVFYGGILYYNRSGNWADGQTIDIDLKLKILIDTDEQKLYDTCVKWINDNLGEQYQINKLDTKTFD